LAVEDYAEDVLKVLNWIDQPAILIGHSMGKITVQKAAEQKNPRALILLASVGPGQLGAIRDPLPPDKTFMFSPEQARKIWFYKIDDQSFKHLDQANKSKIPGNYMFPLSNPHDAPIVDYVPLSNPANKLILFCTCSANPQPACSFFARNQKIEEVWTLVDVCGWILSCDQIFGDRSVDVK
jgi:hypothetical protein